MGPGPGAGSPVGDTAAPRVPIERAEYPGVAPRRSPLSAHRGAVLLGITIASALIALLTWVFGGQGVFHDAYNYYLLAKLIGGAGLFGYVVAPEASTGYYPLLLKAKPNGYPLIVALSGVVSTFDLDSLHGVMFFVQLGALGITSLFAAHRLGRIFSSTRIEIAVYAATVLNPLLLFFVVEMMSDLLSAVFVYVAVVLALKASPGPGAPSSGRDLVLSFVFASIATIIRSGNFVIIAVLVVIWLARWAWYRDVPYRALPVALIGTIVPFVPQLVANYLAFGIVTPFLAESGYVGDLDFGARILKYVTAVIPDQPVQWVYTNPFLPQGVVTVGDFLRSNAPGYLGTLGLHAFALLDQDVPFVFVTEFQPWYRWPLSVLNYLFIGAAGVGFVLAVRHELRVRARDPRTFALVSLFVAGLACLALYIPPHIESRYSLPVYTVWALTSVHGSAWCWNVVRSRRWRPMGVLLGSTAAFLSACIVLSAWLESLRHSLY
jgi:hypothetical protein